MPSGSAEPIVLGTIADSNAVASSSAALAAMPLEALDDPGSPLELQSAPPSDMDKWVKRFERLNPDFIPGNANDARRVCFFGDSDISHWNREGMGFQSDKWVNVGVGGAEVLHMAYFAKQCWDKYRPSVVVLCGGENDIGGGRRT